ncbi:aminoglycoside 6'-N-acetyltransferase [Tellurirhabdus rosea]|uniref:aminoglycoside 6'-N-acetyltransferase n=1 Tax=Tellurirhabdus rosea TaxID=2674997 RepID=UPI002257485D|nr:aminoglycoside 6'-N-acetyltransferase [Tellurirhabdus rosea]
MTIRSATAADLPAWYTLRRQLWSDADPSDWLAEMAGFLQNDRIHVLLAETADGLLVGFLEAGLRDYAEGCESSPVGYIEGWFVADPFRRQGIGAALVRAAETWARQLGCTEMASDVELDNAVSLRAHAALGYDEVERLVCFRKSIN